MRYYYLHLSKLFLLIFTILPYSLFGATYKVHNDELSSEEYSKILVIGKDLPMYLWINYFIGHKLTPKLNLEKKKVKSSFTKQGTSPVAKLKKLNKVPQYFKDEKEKIIYITIPDWSHFNDIEKTTQVVEDDIGSSHKKKVLISFKSIIFVLDKRVNYYYEKQIKKIFNEGSIEHKLVKL